jgi:outer membrane protein
MKKILFAIALVFSVGTVMAQQKIGHVDSKMLLDSLPSHKTAERMLKEYEMSGYQELQDMNDELQRLVTLYEQKKASYTPVVDKIEQDKLQRKNMALQERQQQLQVEMDAYSQELYKPLMDKIEKAIEIIAERKKLSYVIDKSSAFYTKGGIDITLEVIVELKKLDATVVAPK